MRLKILLFDEEKSVSPRVPLFSLSLKHNVVRSLYIDQGLLVRFMEVDQLTDVGGSTVNLVQTVSMKLTVNSPRSMDSAKSWRSQG